MVTDAAGAALAHYADQSAEDLGVPVLDEAGFEKLLASGPDAVR